MKIYVLFILLILRNINYEKIDPMDGIMVENKEIYAEVIKYYYDYINNTMLDDDIEGKEIPFIPFSFRTYSNQIIKLFYALEDIDQNGIPELFIAGYDGRDMWNYEFFTYDGTKVIRPFLEYSGWYQFGHRVNFEFYDNGVFAVHINGGAYSSFDEFYKIASDGYHVELIASTSSYFFDNEGMVYYDDSNESNKNRHEVSEQEVKALHKSMMGTKKANISWIELRPEILKIQT